jgi:ABC-2 type transport system permease protein
MMLRGLWKLTWIEIKVFLREPLGAFGTIVVPVLIFVVLGRVAKLRFGAPSFAAKRTSSADLPVLVALLISVSAVLSLVTIISIYREGGILKRLRATPLRPQTILGAHVIRQAPADCGNIGLMFLAGKRYFPPERMFHGSRLPLHCSSAPGVFFRSAFLSPASFPPRGLRSRSAPSFSTR